MKCPISAWLIFLLGIIVSCTTVEPELQIMHQVTGPIETNCYLIFDTKTKVAALVDVGDIIDTLMWVLEEITTEHFESDAYLDLFKFRAIAENIEHRTGKKPEV